MLKGVKLVNVLKWLKNPKVVSVNSYLRKLRVRNHKNGTMLRALKCNNVKDNLS